jgi:hypothetical protein
VALEYILVATVVTFVWAGLGEYRKMHRSHIVSA